MGVLQPFCGTMESSFGLSRSLSPWQKKHTLFISSVSLVATLSERLFIINNAGK